tara:strand:- start:8958 stop:9215 length:258 start_codon:yes stop_codon:yes gene_type:complete
MNKKDNKMKIIKSIITNKIQTKLTADQKEILKDAIYKNVRKLLDSPIFPENGSMEDLDDNFDKATNKCVRKIIYDIQHWDCKPNS